MRPHWRWRQQSYSEIMALRSLEQSDRRMAVGVATTGLLAASNSSSAIVRNSGAQQVATQSKMLWI